MGLFNKAVTALENAGDALTAAVDGLAPCTCGSFECVCDPAVDNAWENS